MADVAASDVTITILHVKRERGGGEKIVQFRADYGNGVLTYPAGGIPLPSGRSFGLPNHLRQVILTDSDDGQGLMLKLDQTTKKIRHYLPTQQTGGAGDRAGVEYIGGTTAVSPTIVQGEAFGW